MWEVEGGRWDQCTTAQRGAETKIAEEKNAQKNSISQLPNEGYKLKGYRDKCGDDVKNSIAEPIENYTVIYVERLTHLRK